MTVATKTQPNYTTQLAAAYKAAIDAITAVHDRVAGAFAPHEQDVGSPAPDLSMRVDAGYILSGTTLTEVAAQTVSGFTTPSAGQERIDRVVIDASTGAASRVAGTAVSGSPSAVPPAIPSGKLPCCQIRFTDASTAILNSMITDERVPAASPVINGLLDLSSASAGQIKFPATQNASSDANTLDDYEEGTWTPSDASGAGLSLTVTTARYTKIGRLVQCEMDITYPSTANGSNAQIGGLPFTTGAGNASGGVCFYYSQDLNNPIGLLIAGTSMTVYAGPGQLTNAQLSTRILRAVFLYSV